MYKYPQNQSYLASSGQTLTTDVSMTYVTGKFVNKPIVAELHLYRIKLGTKLIRYTRCSLDNGAAYTRGWPSQCVWELLDASPCMAAGSRGIGQSPFPFCFFSAATKTGKSSKWQASAPEATGSRSSDWTAL